VSLSSKAFLKSGRPEFAIAWIFVRGPEFARGSKVWDLFVAGFRLKETFPLSASEEGDVAAEQIRFAMLFKRLFLKRLYLK
jgi:hypothetical protein